MKESTEHRLVDRIDGSLTPGQDRKCDMPEHPMDVQIDGSPTTDPDTRCTCQRCCCCLIFLVLLTSFVLGLWILFRISRPPIVLLAIDSYDGLPLNEFDRVFSPEFNITIYGKEDHGLRWFSDTICYRRGSIKIGYQGWQIAEGPVVGSCLADRNGHTAMLFAWDRNIELPLYLENRLRAEAEQGTAELITEIKLFGEYTYWITCWPLIGDKEYSECHVWRGM